MQSQKFRNIHTGEIATAIPVLTINDWEKYEGEQEPGEIDNAQPTAPNYDEVPR